MAALGIQGVLDEFEEFKRQFPERRAFVLPGTGGAASLLDHLQAIISRMADNSFKLKGWCLTLVSAFLGLALKTDAGAAPSSQIEAPEPRPALGGVH